MNDRKLVINPNQRVAVIGLAFTVVFLLCFAFSRNLLIPPGATNVVSVGRGWREFDYKNCRYLQSPLGHTVPVRDIEGSINHLLNRFSDGHIEIRK